MSMATNLTSPPPEPSAPLVRGESATDAARRVLDGITYMTLATADAAGRPWATPVWFAERDLREFIWVSRFETRHSRNVTERPEVSKRDTQMNSRRSRSANHTGVAPGRPAASAVASVM